ncbi:CD1375 family protein [Cohnella cellulosilytica]|uniref:CD1375 family protein n=1 Tax=Cohnella cellulosilytica TaxID=986710 RepID=A0ABW2FI41_9BACL
MACHRSVLEPGMPQNLNPNQEEMKIMAQIYANLIRKGIKTIDDVPESKRAEVEAILNGSRES